MKYMGSKNRIANDILPIILKNRKENQYYVEPFVGGANIIDKVDGNRIANDNHYHLIEMYKALQNGWMPPYLITEDMYNDIKNNQDKYEPHLVGYVGFSMSFGGKWFGGYRRDKAGSKGDIENMKTQSRRSYNSIMEQLPKIKNIIFLNKPYNELELSDTIIYCDPPYQGTTKYNTNFNHDDFWNWVRLISKTNDVYISEYNAPDDFVCLWQKEINTTISKQNGKIDIEKLFTIKNK